MRASSFSLLMRATLRSLHTLRAGWFIILLLLIALPLVVALAMGVGAVFIPPQDVWAALVDPHAHSAFTIRTYRLPRALGAVLAGAPQPG